MKRGAELALIVVIAAAAIALVRPIGDFPLDDDENCAIAATNFANHHRFEFAIDTTPPLRAQAVWGAAWIWMFGQSFNVLRASTIALALITLIIINLLLSDLPPVPRIVATLAFFFNPIFFWSTHTFMTEVPYVFVCALSLYCFLQALKRESYRWLIAGCVAVAISWWIRQGIINIVPPIVLLALQRERLMKRWRSFLAICVAVLIGYVLMSVFRPDLMVAVPDEFRYHYKMWFESTFRTPEIATLLFSYLFFNVQYTALFFLPLALAAALAMPQLSARWQRVLFVVVAGAMLWRMTQMVARGAPLPYFGSPCCELSYGNIFTNLGLGPPTLTDTWSGVHEYSLHLSHAAQIALSYFSVIVATLAFTSLVIAVVPAFSRARAGEGAGAPLFWLATISVIAGTATTAISGQYIDRYALDTAWAAGIVLALILPWHLARVRVTAIATLIVMAFFSIFATQEYFNWNRQRWAAWDELRARGIAIKDIDGGAEAHLYFEMSQAKTQRERRVMGMDWKPRRYMIAFAPIDGYRVIARRPYDGWLGMHRAEIVTLERIGS
jgi:hypothetical protein